MTARQRTNMVSPRFKRAACFTSFLLQSFCPEIRIISMNSYERNKPNPD
ncbi:MAG: hypothetical protein OP8BY_1495 [Candidatus Saccharicenans subterraneus]|uniref:Uncharacterized protein n=1 Tax=Candidatus Saccharicenans subterraneus TaxID=2508984 RepID=A0A3E2BJT0_9BACT|nr:MAG: hypothetical protein OP8BY_1495 [Candidatus Saccharicenans subterraneum]